jgi:hypothetical protein
MLRTVGVPRLKPLSAKEIEEQLGELPACAIILGDYSQVVDSKAERCPSG